MAVRRVIIGDREIEIPHFSIRGILIPVVLFLLIWFIFGGPFYTVGPEQNGVIRTFGQYTSTTSSGFHVKFPWPVQTVDVVNVESVRRLELGFRTLRGAGTSDSQYRSIPQEASMITGDENIANVEVVIQYKIRDAAQFLFRVENPERIVIHASEAAMRQVVGSKPIDDVLTTGKAIVESETRDLLQSVLDSYEAGVFIQQVKLQDVTPPKAVDAAFKDVQSAKEDKEKMINEALGYKNELIPRARGEAAQMIQQAEAFKQQRVKEAQGDSARFIQVLAEYKQAKDVTRTRMYLETLEKVLSKSENYIVDGEDAGSMVNVLGMSPTTVTAGQGGAK
ncbi:MAG: FtsH protease activity modulator HflK [Candidatus Marinimicrobia bacterium]|nr:FtsH protease activity modulator HflK [Candidatus Neomarinimicrobiota bacterium]